ncbi:tripartite tricarboxylate transporter permease [Chloroflexota bacterium]
MEAFLSAWGWFADPLVLIAMVGGTVVGFIFGVLPGLGGITATALFLPFVYGMNPMVAMSCIAGIMGSSLFGGSITAILLNTPGTGANAATTLDGYPMSRRGEGNKALGIAATSSGAGAMVGVIVLIALLPALRKLVLLIGSPELFMLCVAGLSCVAVAVGGNLLKGIIAAGGGLLISFIGYGAASGNPAESG